MANPRVGDRGQVDLTVRPLLSGRDYHALHCENRAFPFDATHGNGRVTSGAYPGPPEVRAWANGEYRHEPVWYRSFEYEQERDRGLDCVEDRFAPNPQPECGVSCGSVRFTREVTVIRPTTANDAAAILALAVSSGLFPPEGTGEVAAVLGGCLRGDMGTDHVWVTDDDGGPIGVAYYAPERMADGTWNLYMLAVHPDRQREGRGSALVKSHSVTW